MSKFSTAYAQKVTVKCMAEAMKMQFASRSTAVYYNFKRTRRQDAKKSQE